MTRSTTLALLLIVAWATPSEGASTFTADSGTEVLPGDSVTVAVTLDTDETLRGFSIALSHDGILLTLDSITAGSDVAALNSDAGPDYFQVSTDPVGGPGGFVACIIDLELAEVVPAINGQELCLFQYTAATDATAGLTDIEFNDTLGDPPVENLVVPATTSVVPTVVNGTVDILDPPPPTKYTFNAVVTETEAGFLSTVSILESDTNTTFPTDTTGFTAQLGHGFADASVTAVGAALDSEFVDTTLGVDGLVVEVVYSLDLLTTVAFDTTQDVLEITLSGDGPTCIAGSELTVVTWQDDLFVDTPNTVADGSASVEVCFEGGTFLCPAEFIRGDIDGDGVFSGVSDAIRLLCGAFLPGECDGVPCDDAADVDDDGILDPIPDALAILDYAYSDGPAPADPGASTCGRDPTADTLDCAAVPGDCL
jgi:hypothetical protein